MKIINSKALLLLVTLFMVVTSGCSTSLLPSIPADFMLILDAYNTGGQQVQNVNIQINAYGEGHYEIYNTGGAIRMDEHGKVTYESDQIVETGDFELTEAQVAQLWNEINKNGFFQLTGDYRMAMGYAYAFVQVEADGQKHQVDNIGMEVPGIRAIVEKVNTMLPSGVDIVYREGFLP